MPTLCLITLYFELSFMSISLYSLCTLESYYMNYQRHVATLNGLRYLYIHPITYLKVNDFSLTFYTDLHEFGVSPSPLGTLDWVWLCWAWA